MQSLTADACSASTLDTQNAFEESHREVKKLGSSQKGACSFALVRQIPIPGGRTLLRNSQEEDPRRQTKPPELSSWEPSNSQAREVVHPLGCRQHQRKQALRGRGLHLQGTTVRAQSCSLNESVSSLLVAYNVMVCPVTDGTSELMRCRHGRRFLTPGPGVGACCTPILSLPVKCVRTEPIFRYWRNRGSQHRGACPPYAVTRGTADHVTRSSLQPTLGPCFPGLTPEMHRAGWGWRTACLASAAPRPWSWTRGFPLPLSGSCAPHSAALESSCSVIEIHGQARGASSRLGNNFSILMAAPQTRWTADI